MNVAIVGGGVAAATGFNWASALQGYWRFETSPGFTADSSGNANTLTDGGASATQNTSVYIEGAASLDCGGDTTGDMYLADGDLSAGFPGKATTGYQNFLVTAWIRADTVTESAALITKYYATDGQRSWMMGILYGTGANIRITTSSLGTSASVSGYTFTAVDGGVDLAADTWYHVAIWFDTTLNKRGIRVKENGGSTYNYSAEHTANVYLGTAKFSIGQQRSSADSTSSDFNGKVDKVVIYSWADGSNPTEDEIVTQIDALSAGTAP